MTSANKTTASNSSQTPTVSANLTQQPIGSFQTTSSPKSSTTSMQAQPPSFIQTGMSLDEKQRAYSTFAMELLSHLYSGNIEYQDRLISTYFHPSATFTDPFVLVSGRRAIQSLWHAYFGLVVREVDIEVVHVSVAPMQISVPVPQYSSSKKPALETNQSTIMLKRKGLTFLIDYNVRTRELTFLGRTLKCLRLLFPPVLMSYCPRDTIFPQNLRIISKINWITDMQAPMHPTTFNERGYIVHHENMYNPSRQSGYMVTYLFFWISLWVSFFVLLLQKASAVISNVLGRVSISPDGHTNYSRNMQSVNRLQMLWSQRVPSDFETSLKQAFGSFIVGCVDYLTRGNNSNGASFDFSQRKPVSHVAEAG